MCGLVAAFSSGAPLAPDALARPLAALAHRGPDGEGQWFAEDRRVALGHRRLAIVDRASGAQPLVNEDRSVVAIVSGEFYEHAQIRARLRARGHQFRTGSDSEILVHLYEDHGVEAVHELRGEFAWILWDARRRVGFAARDRFGIRPLVHAEIRAEIGAAHWFASEAKALLAAGLRPAWDEQAVFAATRMQYPLPSRSVFRGVGQVEPGELVILGDGLSRRRYWDLGYPREADVAPLDAQGRADAIAEVAAAFDEAVRIRVRDAEVPIAFQLSGGLDSSAVVAAAAAHLDQPPVCFTVGFDRPGYDERALAQASAAFLGAELRVVEVSPASIVDQLPDAVTRAEGLAINGHIAAKHLLAQTIRAAGFGVVLTGEGSDEVFAGYAHLRQDHYAGDERRLAELDASNQASAGLMLAHGEGLELASIARALGYVPAWMAAKASLGRRVSALLDDGFLAEHREQDPYDRLLADVDVHGQLRGRARVHQSSYLWSKTAMATYILRTLGDGIEMASSLEGRLPFLDHHLFERVRELPVDLLIRDGVEKWILREALGPRIPPAIRTRQKHPFLAPPLTLLGAGRGQGPIVDALRGALPSFVDRRKLDAVLDRLAGLADDDPERAAWDPALMLIASAAILQRSYGL